MPGRLKERIKSRSRAEKVLLLCLLPVAAYGLLRLAAYAYAQAVAPWMPPCILRTLTGWKCPSCGMTHSVYALARLDLAAALRENAIIPVLLVVPLLRYAELWTAVLGRPRRLMPHGGKFWLGVLLAVLAYSVLRNIAAF